MIEFIKLRNFQGHKKLLVRFDPKVTTIIGDTDQGKTSIFRAIAWLAKAKPGTRVIHHGADKCSVVIGVDGQRVSRSRGIKAASSYKLDGEVYTASGTVAPDCISLLLNFDDINFQTQMESPLWMFDSPGKVSKHLNRIVNLDVIDRATGAAATHTRKAKQTVTIIQEQLADSEQTITDLSWVTRFEIDLGRVKRARSSLQTALEAHRTATEAVSRVQTHQVSSEILGAINYKGRKLAKVLDTLIVKQQESRELQKLIRATEEATEAAEAEVPDISKLEELTHDIAKQNEILHKTQVKELKLRTATNNILNMQNQLDNYSEQLVKVTEQFNSEFKGVCPLCQK